MKEGSNVRELFLASLGVNLLLALIFYWAGFGNLSLVPLIVNAIHAAVISAVATEEATSKTPYIIGDSKGIEYLTRKELEERLKKA